MDLMTLAAKIQLDDSSYVKGVGNAEKMGQQLAGKLSAMTVAVGNIVADMMRKAINGVQNIIGGAIDGYADYQQLIGGVETLFKNSASKVQGYARNAYKTAGLSANQYMETVTGFSASLLQGLKGDTEQAAEIANIAVTDMADNANKMGTDMASIQAAYQGFAKQNYTMLDNLKLGYGGTREEMIRLINDSGILEEEISDLDGITFDQLVLAIHKIQTEMGITGTTAKEAAETISGSKASLAAAWGDMLSAVGGEGDQQRLDEAMENFKASFSTYMENFIPTLVTTISNSGSLVTAIAESIGNLPTDLLSQVGESALNSGTEMVGAVGTITHWLIESIGNMFTHAKANPDEIKNFGESIGNFLADTIKDIVEYAPDILSSIIDVGIALSGGLVQGLFEGLFGSDAEVSKITKQLEGDLTDIDLNNDKATGILRYMNKLYETYGAGVQEMAEWKEAQAALEEVMPGAGEVFQQYGDDVAGAVAQLQSLNEELRKSAIMTGIQRRMQEMSDLYGEQLATYTNALIEYEENNQMMEVMKDKARSSIKAFADFLFNEGGLQYWDEEADLTGISRKVRQVQETGTWTTPSGETYDLATATEAQLMGLAEELYRQIEDMPWLKNSDGTNIWDNPIDEIYSLKELQQDQREIEELETRNEHLKGTAEEAQRQAQSTAAELDKWQKVTDLALADQMASWAEGEYPTDDMTDAGQDASDALDEAGNAISASGEEAGAKVYAGGEAAAAGVIAGGDAFAAALSEKAAEIGDIVIPKGDLFGWKPHAIGLDYVPNDDYRAMLHKGEAVLTKAEADAWRKGGVNAGQVAGMISDAIESSMSKIAVMMSGEKVGDLTTRRVQKNISAYNYAKLRSMGG